MLCKSPTSGVILSTSPTLNFPKPFRFPDAFLGLKTKLPDVMYTKSRSKSCSNDTNLRLFSPVIRRLEDANHHLDAGEKKRSFLRVPTFDSLRAAAWDEGFQMLKRLTVLFIYT